MSVSSRDKKFAEKEELKRFIVLCAVNQFLLLLVKRLIISWREDLKTRF